MTVVTEATVTVMAMAMAVIIQKFDDDGGIKVHSKHYPNELDGPTQPNLNYVSEVTII